MQQLCVLGHSVVNLYPAWQVPLGYMFLAIGIWLIHENWSSIKQFTKRDWLLLIGALILCFGLVANYFLSMSEYIEVTQIIPHIQELDLIVDHII